MSEKRLLRIGFYPSGNIYDVDHNGLGYGMLFWDEVLAFIEAGGGRVINAKTGKVYTARSVRNLLKKV